MVCEKMKLKSEIPEKDGPGVQRAFFLPVYKAATEEG
jgi:hypothetical protein